MNKKYKIIAIYGKSGAGKDTIQKEMVKLFPHIFNSIVSCTTRPKRDYEINGIDYHFLSKAAMRNLINNGEMLEYSIFNNWYYGTGKMSLDINKINIGVFNLDGIRSLLNRYDVEIFPICITANGKTRLLRNIKRENNPNCYEICRRYLADEKDFYKCEEFLSSLHHPFLIFNNEDGMIIEEEIKKNNTLMSIIQEWTNELNIS